MAKKKSKAAKQSGRRGNDATTTSKEIAAPSPRLVGGALAALLLAVAVAVYASSSRSANRPPATQNETEGQPRKKEAFLRWFVAGGGTFHPVDAGDGQFVNVTIEEFPDYGGWGLALPVLPHSAPSEEECQSHNENDNEQCVVRDKRRPIIRHLDPLFTVPSSMIISVASILDAYARSDSPLYLPHFYPDVNKLLADHFSDGSTGLAPRGMGLVQQDVVVALFLMAEECPHRHPDAFANSGESRWGPYLDVLPEYTIPRLDTFDDEAYAALRDEALERTGRNSRRVLERVYSNGGNVPLQSVVRDMIRKKAGPTPSPVAMPPSCVGFETFHRFVAIVSSRAMVLKGTKHLTPLAEMINYAPKANPKQNERDQDWIQAPFDLYHTVSDDGSITVRSDRDIFLGAEPTLQIFEDYGPVDNSLFLEAHGFVPHENPNNCAIISGLLFLRRHVASGRHDENAGLVLAAMKALRLIHPQARAFESLEDVCVRANLKVVDDGNMVGRRPASDSIAMASLLLGDSDGSVWDRIEHSHGETFASLREKCVAAVDLGDAELMEVRCARYPGSDGVVRHALRTAAVRAIARLEANGDTEEKLLVRLQTAESPGSPQLALAFRFRLQERRILSQISNAPDQGGSDEEATTQPKSSDPAESLEGKLVAFNSFIESFHLPLNKIEPRITGDGMRLGAFATEDIDEGEVYLALDADSVIDVDAALAGLDDDSGLAELLRKYTRNDGFDALLLYLLHERFVLMEHSRWWPYLDLLPSIEEMSEFHPLFFPEAEMNQYLAGSDVRRFILQYQHRAAERHRALVSDLDANLIIGSDILLSKKKVYWATAIVDSRSIWWDGMRHLSPLLDLVNADNIGRAHQTLLENSEDAKQKIAVTRASRRIQKGNQVFENYAQPNYLLFTYHGFLLEENAHDCALLDGLSINRNDPGAKNFHQLRSTSPTFCIRDEASVGELVRFLRVKHGLSSDNSSGLAIDDDVRSYLIRVLEDRIARLSEAVDNTTLHGGVTRAQHMRQVVRNDLKHFQHAMISAAQGS